MNSAATVMNSMWIVIFVPYSMNPCDVTVHAQEKKKKSENTNWKNADAHPKRSHNL